MNVVLTGMKHCGKSTIGLALAERWGCAFHDVDPMIEATAECEIGQKMSVREIFNKHGEDAFHRWEGHVVCELYLKLDHPGSTSVVSLGGRTALNRTIVELLRAIGLIVHLEVDPEELFKRVEQAGLPPFVDQTDPKEDFLRLYAEREPHYRNLADLTVNLDGLTVEQAVEELARRIEECSNARQ